MACFLILLCFWGAASPAQRSQEILSTLSLSEKQEKMEGAALNIPHQLEYWPVIPGTEKFWVDGILKIRGVDYTIDYRLGQITVKTKVEPWQFVRITYQIIPISIRKSYRRDIFAPLKPPSSEEKAIPSDETTDLRQIEEPKSTLTFSGAKTVSLSMESARGLTINQPTRLNVSGNVSENVSVTAMLSDQDLPLQPEGTTEEIEELDRILIKVQGKHLSATLGDYEAAFGETEFVLQPKMLEGAQAQGEFNAGGFTLLGAVSRGQTASVTLPGVEGQNEYRINVNGNYIIMIAGSEEVWLNGERMRRGEKNDYVIQDYGDPIVEFTNEHLITANDVIVVDFEYIEEDRNYRQDLYGTRGKVNLADFGDGLTLGISYATESDDMDNPLIILDDDEIASLKLNDLDPDGDGIPLQAPSKRSVIGFDSRLSLGESTNLNGEIAFSELDSNTFSENDTTENGMAWKLRGASGFDKFSLDFDLRQLDPEFVPIGATFSSRTRSTYQENYDDVTFGEILPNAQSPQGEASYDVNLRYRPIEYFELRGDLGRTSREYREISSSETTKRSTDHWGRSLKLNLPELPQISTRYQEAVTAIDSRDDVKKTRELWQLDHRLWGKLNIGARSEDIESVSYFSNDTDRRRHERRFTFEAPTFKTVSMSGEYSFETEYASKGAEEWSKLSSAHTASANLSARPRSWLDFSGYFARRKFSRLSENMLAIQTPADATTNLADMKMSLKWLRLNYQIDKKLSSEREEQYVNYIITRMDGVEQKRFLKPGEGSYVKIDEYTYREDPEEGEYIRLVRTVRDRPVTSLDVQAVFSLRPRGYSHIRSAGMGSDVNKSIADRLKGILSMLEVGIRISEEQENASGRFYLLQDLMTDGTIYGNRRHWYRAQLSLSKYLSLRANWDDSQTINKRINGRIRKYDTNRWSIRLDSPLTTRLSLGGEWERDDSSETVSSLLESSEGDVVSDISEEQQSRSIFLRYHPSKILSRLKLEGTYETEWDDDPLSDEPPVFTETLSIGSEAAWNIRGKGLTAVRYQIARGESSSELPFARYDFHEGISHNIRLEMNYRLQWFTDVMARITYRAEITEQEKPDHRLEMEMTANF